MTSPVLVENRSGRTCGCALANVRHAMEDPKKRLGAAVGVAAATAWYGLPDVVRCRGARAVIKAGLLAAVMWSATAQMPPAAPVPPYPDEESDCDGTPAPKGDDPLEGVTEAAPGELALLAGAAHADVRSCGPGCYTDSPKRGGGKVKLAKIGSYTAVEVRRERAPEAAPEVAAAPAAQPATRQVAARVPVAPRRPGPSRPPSTWSWPPPATRAP